MSDKNTTVKIAKSGLWLTSGYAISRVGQLIAQICLARLLSPEDFGVWAMVLVVTILTDLFQDNATAAVLIQRGLEDKKLVDAVYSIGVNLSIFMFIVQALAGLPISWFFEQPVLFPLIVCVSLKFLINAGTGTRGAILQRQMKFREVAISNIGNGIARMCGTLILAAFGAGVWSFAGGEICKAIVDAGLKRWYCRYHCTYHLFPDQQAVRDVWSYTSGLIGINLAVYANTNGDNFLIGKLLGTKLLGYYNLAYQLAMLPAFALSQINKVNFSVLSRRDDEGKQSYLRQILEYYALFYSQIYSVGFVVAPWIIPLVYGSEWEGVVPIYQIVIIYAYARGFMSIMGTTLNSLNQPRTNAKINWALVPLSIPAFFIGAKLGGTVGVAIAVALVMGIGATIWFWFATCRAAKWNLVTLAKPVILPTVVAIFSAEVVMFSTASLTLQMKMLLQPILVISINALLLSIFSRGRIPLTVIKLIKKLMKPKAKLADS
ncbi:lipopolysaccharide biosynthesis protein [Anabaena sp. UHCC 0451]|uniref:lipopolysaccharide biosynthesis protein n=1 Tax=Anabaena sp. UHCC 0451 TaxID=2055235 RepID=UPI002B21D6A7|nr:lipopolysaccharide biosynthesis protein [Anabaena sp. UHCC 0451]MEA5579249.1 lipopolysaccharide biosynthesis protein [Anabaena sp. UHCC 0451]